MQSLFSADNKIFQFINRLFFSAWLNILWFICCIPIVTIGASTTALYYVSLKMAANEEGNITAQFFHSFRENIKKATGIWMILLVVGIILGTDGYVLYRIHYDNILWTICTAFLIGAAILYLIILLNIFPLLAHFDNTIKAMFKNAFIVGVRYLFCTIMMAVVYFVIYYIVINLFTPFIVFGQGLGALICSWLIRPILKKLEPAEE
ncbi:MAG: DUF624 domain-containing protein [Clostridia bacterium]|nr:DUF624 domain-containing protein [Clostridia bacterium]NCC44943.1 DUF624 domain-containing protein [Clostridia bacterium]